MSEGMVWCEKCKKYHDGTGCPSASIFPSAITDWVDGQCFKQTGQATIDIDGLKAGLAALRAERDRLREALVQITKRDDWTSGECRFHARVALKEE